MERRACKRIPVKVGLTFFYINYLYHGIAENVSHKGICFSTPDMLVPHGSLVELLIPLKENFLSVHARVNRLSVKTASAINFFLGADVLNPPKEYLNFVNSFHPAA